jgi:CHASE1-domain containing sensor protein
MMERESSSESARELGKETIFWVGDLVPVILAILSIMICLTIGLLSYFLIQNAEYAQARTDLSTITQNGANLLQRQVDDALGVVQSVKTYMYLKDGDALAVDQRKEWDVFCNGMGGFPKEVFYFSYLAIVPGYNASNWVAAMRNKGPDYTNFTMTFRDANNSVIPAPPADYHYVAALTSPLTFIATNGYDNAPSPIRNASIQECMRTGRPTAGGKVTFSITTFTSQPGFNVYLAVMSRTTPFVPLGIILTGFRAGDIIQTALASMTTNVIVNVYDMNATDPTGYFMYCTQQWDGGNQYYTDMPASKAQTYVDSAPYYERATVMIADRTYLVLFMPTDTFLSSHVNNAKAFILAAVLVVMVVLLLGCVALFFAGRLYRKKQLFSKRVRQLDTERLTLLEMNKVKLEQLLNQIAQQEYKTRLINNTIPDMILVITESGQITQTNSSFDKAFSFTEMEYEKGINVTIIFPELQSNFYVSSREMMSTNAKTRFGTLLPVELVARSLKKEDSMVTTEDSEAFVIIVKTSYLRYDSPNVVHTPTVTPMMRNFENDWKHDKPRKRLLQFAKKELNDENLLFLDSVTRFKRMPLEQRVDMQKQIYDEFIAHGADRQLNINKDLATNLYIKMGKSLGDLNLFDEVEEFVKRMVVEDFYPRFAADEKGRQTNDTSSSGMSSLKEED